MSSAASVEEASLPPEDRPLPVQVKEETELTKDSDCANDDTAVKNAGWSDTCVKQEPWVRESGISEAAMLAGLYTDHVVKDELVLGPERVQSPPLCSDGVSDAAVLAGLYTDHVVKDELVLGPEHVQRLPELQSSNQSSAVQMPSGQFALRECLVRLERIPYEAALRRLTASQSLTSQAQLIGSHKLLDIKTNTYICDTCGIMFQRRHQLIQHIQSHNMLKKGSNKITKNQLHVLRKGNTMKSKSDIHGHTPTLKTCNRCGLCFENGHKCKAYTCEICGKQFSQSGHLGRHNRIHRKELYACDICNKKFTRLNNLRNHELSHTGQKPYFCDICNKQFRQLRTLKTHNQIHTGEKPYSCEICNKRFTRANNIKRHKRTHTGETQYSCEICKKEFTRMSNLKEHKWTHYGEKSYSCEICKREFARLRTLKSHEQKFHMSDK